MREIVIVISDLYFPPGEIGPPRERASAREPSPARDARPTNKASLASAEGVPDSLHGFEHAARFGHRSALDSGWRPWLARWLGRDDLASVAPAVIAAAAPSATAMPSVTAAMSATAMPSVTAAMSATATPNPTAAPSATNQLTPTSTAWIATPVHLIAGLTSLHLDRRSLLRLRAAELTNFAHDFNQTFADSGLLLNPLASGDFLLEGPSTLTGSTTEPARALVADLEASLPKGNDAKPLKRLGAELEMWFHAHPLNETRRLRGELPVSSLWLWGGGPLDAHVALHPAPAVATTTNLAATQPTATHAHAAPTAIAPTNASAITAIAPTNAPAITATDRAFGTDPYLAGLWHLSRGAQPHPLPDQLTSPLSDPHSQRAVFVIEVSPMLHSNPHWTVLEALAEIDRRLVSPALIALRQGTLETLTLIANDTELRLHRHDRLKFWRRRKSVLTSLQS